MLQLWLWDGFAVPLPISIVLLGDKRAIIRGVKEWLQRKWDVPKALT